MKFTKNISKTFFVFLILSLLIWLLITLSKEYIAQVSLNVSYNELPQDKILQKEPLKEIEIIAKGTGFKILSTRFFNHSVQLETNNLLKKNSKNYFILTSNQKLHIQQQLVSGLKLEAFLKDTIYLEIGSLISKKVPVVPNLKIDYQIGFDALKPIEIKPDSILISGSKLQVNAVKSVTFQPLLLEKVNANFSKKSVILAPKNTNDIKFSVKEVLVSGFVEKFTEGSFTIPFTIKNITNNVNLTTFPKKVKIVFKVDLPRFNSVNKKLFTVVCDYSISEKNGFTYLIPRITSKPDFVKNVKIIPNKIEYLIQK